MNYYCMYCSQRCSKKFPTSPYWNCKECEVRFMEGVSGCDIIEFTRKLKEGGRTYRLELYIQLNKTMLKNIDNEYGMLSWPGDEDVLIDVKGVLNGVKPDNVEAKIKNLLLFL